MRADEVLVAHHAVLRGLLHELEGSGDDEADRRRELLDRFVLELHLHTQIEDELFYPAVHAVSPLLSLAHAEHRQIDEQLATVLRTPAAGPDLAVEVRMLRLTLEHHAGEEEELMFAQAQALGPARLEELGAQLQQRQDALRRSRTARAAWWVKREVLRRV